MIVATGPLTSDALSADIARARRQRAPVLLRRDQPDRPRRDDRSRRRCSAQSRWDRSLRGRRRACHGVPRCRASRRPRRAASTTAQGDYLNCPLTRDEYERFYDALVHAESATVHDFDKEKFFEGCLPIEVMAHRGADTLRFGPMKPVGLVDPRTGREPYAAVQLRQDNLAGDHFSLVGFQTQIKWGEQARVLRLIPGLEQAEFVRFGMVHRNTYVNGPTVLRETWQVRARPTLFFAGQMSGVEGYVESAASGLLAGLQRGRARARRAAVGAAAHDRDRRAGVLRVARRSGALRAVEHHVRHHAAARARRREARSWSASWRSSERALADLDGVDATPQACRMTRTPQGVPASFSRSTATRRRTPSAPTRAICRSSSTHVAAGAGVKRARPRRRRSSTARRIRGFSPSCTRAGAVARDGRAQAGGDPHVPPLPAPRRADRRRSRRAGRDAEARQCACRRTCPKRR